MNASVKPKHYLSVLQILFYSLLVPAHIITARFSAALPAFQIIGGIQRPAFLTGIMLDHFRVPFFISDFFDALLGFPQLNTMRHLCLKRFQICTRVFCTLPAKFHSFCRRAFCHRTFGLAVKAAPLRSAAVTLHFLKGPLKTLGHYLEPLGLFFRANKGAASGAKQAADCSKTFIRDMNVFTCFFHSVATFADAGIGFADTVNEPDLTLAWPASWTGYSASVEFLDTEVLISYPHFLQ